MISSSKKISFGELELNLIEKNFGVKDIMNVFAPLRFELSILKPDFTEEDFELFSQKIIDKCLWTLTTSKLPFEIQESLYFDYEVLPKTFQDYLIELNKEYQLFNTNTLEVLKKQEGFSFEWDYEDRALYDRTLTNEIVYKQVENIYLFQTLPTYSCFINLFEETFEIFEGNIYWKVSTLYEKLLGSAIPNIEIECQYGGNSLFSVQNDWENLIVYVEAYIGDCGAIYCVALDNDTYSTIDMS